MASSTGSAETTSCQAAAALSVKVFMQVVDSEAGQYRQTRGANLCNCVHMLVAPLHNPSRHRAPTSPVQQIELSYVIAPRRNGRKLIRNPLMELLHAVREHGSISAASKVLGLSYRHVWGELKRWEQTLGHPLVSGAQGRSAQLSEFGDKLLWAERQAQARLAPQIEALHADLERAFALAFDEGIHVLSLHASHDEALVLLRAHAAESARLQLDIRFTGSVDAISALNQGRCVMAGFHTLERPPRGSLAQRTYKPLLKPGLHKVIGFARRTQGLIVAPGNPLGLRSLADVASRRARYVNRALGTGTRVLLDELLEEQKLDAGAIARLRRTASLRMRQSRTRWRPARPMPGSESNRLRAMPDSASCRWCESATTWPA